MNPSNEAAPRGLIGYGEHNPPPVINAVDYPHRLLIRGADIDKPTMILWLDHDPLPFDIDALESIVNMLATGGGFFILARDAGVLERVKAAIVMLAATPAESWQ